MRKDYEKPVVDIVDYTTEAIANYDQGVGSGYDVE